MSSTTPDNLLYSIATDGLKAAIAESSENLGQSSQLAMELIAESIDTLRELVPNRPRLLGQVLGEHLHKAAELSRADAIDALAAAGANVNWRDGNGCTALHRAVEREDEDALRALVVAGADINAQVVSSINLNNTTGTALHIAADRNLLAMVDLLLELGSDPNIEDLKKGETPLDRVASRALTSGTHKEQQRAINNALYLTKCFVDYDADLLRRNRLDQIPLIAALHPNGHEDVAVFLASQVNYEQPDLDTALRLAINRNSHVAIKALVGAGANPCVDGMLEGNLTANSETRALVNSLITERTVSDSLGNQQESEQSAPARRRAPSPM